MTRKSSKSDKATKRRSDEGSPRRRPSALGRKSFPLALRRGAAIYPLVFAIAAILALTALTLLAVRRADARIHANLRRSVQAQYIALAGIERALGYMDSNPTWRQTLSSGTWFLDQAFGRGTFTVEGIDPTGNLADSAMDILTLLSTGAVDGAVSKVQVTLTPKPHPALKYACFSNSALDVRETTLKGPMRANQQITTDGKATLTDNVYFETVAGYSIDPRLSPARFDSSPMSYPQPNLAYYLALATPITGNAGKLNQYNLTPTCNSEPPNTVNPNGIYSFNATGQNVTIEKSHIKGTLIIYNAATVTIQRQCWIESAGLPLPTLLIYAGAGDVEFNLDQPTLSESSENVDFNGDGDQLDFFPTTVQGLVWTQNSLIQLRRAVLYTGCFIGASIKCYEKAAINDDASLAELMIPGFVVGDMQIVQGSWREVQP